MARLRRVPGEKSLFWVGSSKEDLLAFPAAVQDEIGTALSVAQFGGKQPSAKPWKDRDRESLRLSKTIVATRTGRFTRSDSKVSSTFFMRSKRNRRVAYGPRRGT